MCPRPPHFLSASYAPGYVNTIIEYFNRFAQNIKKLASCIQVLRNKIQNYGCFELYYIITQKYANIVFTVVSFTQYKSDHPKYNF